MRSALVTVLMMPVWELFLLAIPKPKIDFKSHSVKPTVTHWSAIVRPG